MPPKHAYTRRNRTPVRTSVRIGVVDAQPHNEVIVKTNGRFVPVSFKSAPSAASGEGLSTHRIPEALQTVLVEGVDPATAVAEAHPKIEAVFKRLG